MRDRQEADAEERRLLAAISCAPDDDVPRLFYAEWLAYREDLRGEFIVRQCERTNLRSKMLEARETELLSQHLVEWAAGFADLVCFDHFERGFLRHPLVIPACVTAHACCSVDAPTA